MLSDCCLGVGFIVSASMAKPDETVRRVGAFETNSSLCSC